MNENYSPTIGLEIHAELNTKTKMFCNSLNDPEEKEPNKNICPICTGHPGTLPTINKQAVKHILKMGLAVTGKIADFSEFDRKNYFYPDIPKGYQISQYKYPLVSGGMLAQVALTRIHLEEDTARSSHEGEEFSLLDFNRAGVPLMELVTEPVITSSKAAAEFARELQLLLRFLGASHANMEKGEMRVEANISVSKTKQFGTKVEVKNLNSFKAVEKAIEYEIKRQSALLEKGEKVTQETRGWDEVRGVTFSQRKKEDSHDYRYFPEPDLPKLHIGEIEEFSLEKLKSELPELPWEKRERYKSAGIGNEYSEMFLSDLQSAALFEDTWKLRSNSAKLIANYIGSDIAGLVSKGEKENLKNITAEKLAIIIGMVEQNKISSRGAKDILAHIFTNKGDIEKIAQEKNLYQKSDEGELSVIAKKIISEHSNVWQEYKSGKIAALQFLIGQAMKATKGSANPEKLKQIFANLQDA